MNIADQKIYARLSLPWSIEYMIHALPLVAIALAAANSLVSFEEESVIAKATEADSIKAPRAMPW